MRLLSILLLAAGLVFVSATPIAENNYRNVTVRHEKRKRLRGDSIHFPAHPIPEERTKIRNTEKLFLVNNRTVQILGESVQQILNDSRKWKIKHNSNKSNHGPVDLSKILKDKTTNNVKSKISESSSQSVAKSRSAGVTSYQNVEIRTDEKNTTMENVRNNDVENFRNQVDNSKKHYESPLISEIDITSEITSAFYTDSSSRTEEFKGAVKPSIRNSSTTASVDDLKSLDINYDLEMFNLSGYASEGSSLSNILKDLLDKLSNSDKEIDQESTPPCQMWADCRWKLQEVLIGSLPSCPCSYPSIIFYNDRIWDESNQRFYRWKDASSTSERLDVYKRGAKHCVRSIAADLYSIAAQHCCYDKNHRLLTRGSGAGNPNLVSPDISPPLHYKIDILPWHHCKGDFTRYNKVRPPNNGNSCPLNPGEDEYQQQVEMATSF